MALNWTEFTENLLKIYEMGPPLPAQFYMEMYTQVFTHCSTSGKNREVSTFHELYTKLKCFFTNYAKNLHKQISNEHGSNMIKCYAELWRKYKNGSFCINGIFSYFNRHWNYEMRANPGEVVEVYPLAMKIWKEEIFDKIHHQITSTALEELVEKNRLEWANTVAGSYIEIGVNRQEDGLLRLMAPANN